MESTAMRRSIFFAMALCGPAFALSVQGQVPTGWVSGIARDGSGRVVQGAAVRATANAQGNVRTSNTNANGSFLLENLAPGSYMIVISSPGFADVRYGDVRVEAGKALTLDTTLPVAQQNSTVNVSTSAHGVDLQQSIIQGQITSRTIESIPLNGRNFLELAYLIPWQPPSAGLRPHQDEHA